MCWGEEGCPTTLPAGALDALEAVSDLYNAPDGEGGGPLHAWIDDGSGSYIDGPHRLDEDHDFPAQTMEAACRLVDLFAPMKAAERAAVVALYRLDWPSFRIHHRPESGPMFSCCGNDGTPAHLHVKRPDGVAPWEWDICHECAFAAAANPEAYRYLTRDLSEHTPLAVTAHDVVIAPDWMYQAATADRPGSPATIDFFDTDEHRERLHEWISQFEPR